PPYRHLLDVSLATRPVASNLLTQSHAVLYLAAELLRPWHQDIDPQLAVVQGAGFTDIALLAGWVALAVLAAWQRQRHPQAAFALLWFLACLAPSNSLLPRLDVANDRELYLALAGPAWLVAVALVRMPWRVAVPLGVALIALLAGCTLLRNRDYADEVGFWQAALHSSPGNARAANNLGMAYALDCRDRAARAWFERAVALAPGDYRARINLRLLRSGELVTPAERRCGQGGGHGSNPE
ncbi:MAG: hypothetical protein RL684_2839, partial [Pseudomonadota bacterium]